MPHVQALVKWANHCCCCARGSLLYSLKQIIAVQHLKLNRGPKIIIGGRTGQPHALGTASRCCCLSVCCCCLSHPTNEHMMPYGRLQLL
jgi:hypothetical protein